MKTILSIAFATLGVGLFAAPEKQTQRSRDEMISAMKKMSSQEREARIAMHRAEAERNLGGYLVLPSTGNVIRVENAQKLVAKGDLESLCEKFSRSIGATIEIVEPSQPKNPKTVVTIQFVENGNGPVLLIAPEDKYGILNVTRLTADSPDNFRLRQRFGVEFWRVMCLTLGGYQSNVTPCSMRTIFSLADLDKDPASCVCPEVFGKVQMTCRELGIKGPRRISYRRACVDGIAPAPTNDVQKAIWDKVHAMPAAPIKIKPESQKVKE